MCTATDMAPALCPKMVSSSGLPPNAAMLFLTHLNDTLAYDAPHHAMVHAQRVRIATPTQTLSSHVLLVQDAKIPADSVVSVEKPKGTQAVLNYNHDNIVVRSDP